MEFNGYTMLLSTAVLVLLLSSFAASEPVPGHNQVPYYKKQGIEKFLDEDDRLRKHCISLIESGVEVDDLEPECQAIYYKEEYEDNDHRNGAGSPEADPSRILFSAAAALLSGLLAL